MNLDVLRPSDFRERQFSCPGERFKDVYQLVYQQDGTISLEVVDKVDLYAQIQSFKDSTDINKLLERFSETGDMSIFFQHQTDPLYGDFVNVPHTIAEAFQLVSDAENAFMQLPPDERSKYTGPAEWLTAMVEAAPEMPVEGPKSADSVTKVDEVNKDA